MLPTGTALAATPTAQGADGASDCLPFPVGDFGADPDGVTLPAGGPDTCLTIPADDHSTRELITSTVDDPSFGFSVLDENDTTVCGHTEWGGAPEGCSLTPGSAYTVHVPGGVPWDQTLVRRDITADAQGCVETPATKVGSPSLGGVPAPYGSYLCHRVTTADARDTLHLNARYTAAGLATGFGVYDADGEVACEDLGSGCAVTGSTAYQAIVHVGNGDTTPPVYRFDAVRVATAAGPAPECVKVPDVTYGFGPLTGTLSEQRPTLCAVLPTASEDWLKLSFAPAQELMKSPTPWLYDGATRQNVCSSVRSDDYYSCEVPGENEHVSRPTTLVIGLPSVPSQAPTEVRASAYCQFLCGTVTRAVTAVSPGTVGAGKITMRVTGAALHEKDVVEVSGGSFRARSTTVSVAPDRRSVDVSLDLTNAPRTALNLSVVTHDGTTHQRGRVTVVGAKVTAKAGSWSPAPSSYAYQWRANGVAIAGATGSTYVVPASVVGKKLTVTVTAHRTGHLSGAHTTVGYTVAPGLAPKATTAPYLTGTVKVGRTLTLNRGTWTPAPSSYTYQWYANGRAISGATRATLTLAKAQRGAKITVKVTAQRTGHLSGVAWTRSTGAVAG